MPDYTQVLDRIARALDDPAQTQNVSALVREVREAIRGQGQATVRDSFIEIRDTLKTEFTAIRNVLIGGPGAPAGGGPINGKVAPDQQRLQIENNLQFEKMNKTLTEVVEQLMLIGEFMHGGGGHGGIGGIGGAGGGFGGGLSPFAVTTFGRQIDLVKDLAKQNSGLLETLRGIAQGYGGSKGFMGAEYEQHQRDAIFGLTNLTARSTDLVLIFERLASFIRTNILERATGFMANRAGNLSGAEYLTDDLKRMVDVLHGTRPEMGYGLVNTQEGVKKAIAEGMASPMLMFGQNIDKLSFMYHQNIDDMERRGFNARGLGSPEQLQQLMQILQSREQSLGPFQELRSVQTLQTQQKTLEYLADIAKHTGVSVEQLAKMVQSATQSATELAAMGIIDGDMAKKLTDFQANLVPFGKQGEVIGQLLTKFAGAGFDPTMFYALNEKMAGMDSRTQQTLTGFLSQITTVMKSDMSASQQREEVIRIAREMGPQMTETVKGMGPFLYKEFPELGQILGAVRSVGGLAPGSVEAAKPGMVETVLQKFEDWSKRFPMFEAATVGFAGAVATFGFYVTKLAIAGSALSALGIAGGAVPGAGGMLQSLAPAGLAGAAGYVGRLATKAIPVVGGAIAAGTAAASGDSFGGIAGAGLGTIVGGILGSFIPGLGNVVGAAVGSALGGFAGEKLGNLLSPAAAAAAPAEKMMNMVSPAAAAPPEKMMNMVSPADAAAASNEKMMNMFGQMMNLLQAVGPSDARSSPIATAPAVAGLGNVAGPQAAAVAGVVDTQRTYQEQQVQMLTALLGAAVDGNNILGQMYGELARQTGYLTGSPASTSTPQPGRGLSVSVPAVANAGRPDPGTPYAGTGM